MAGSEDEEEGTRISGFAANRFARKKERGVPCAPTDPPIAASDLTSGRTTFQKFGDGTSCEVRRLVTGKTFQSQGAHFGPVSPSLGGRKTLSVGF